MATFLDLFGVAPPAEVQGRSLLPVLAQDQPLREAALFGYFGGAVTSPTAATPISAIRAIRASQEVYQYTVMPTHLRDLFTPEELSTATLSPPFPFTKGVPLLRVPVIERSPMYTNYGPGALVDRETVLFDLQTDPDQLSPDPRSRGRGAPERADGRADGRDRRPRRGVRARRPRARWAPRQAERRRDRRSGDSRLPRSRSTGSASTSAPPRRRWCSTGSASRSTTTSSWRCSDAAAAASPRCSTWSRSCSSPTSGEIRSRAGRVMEPQRDNGMMFQQRPVPVADRAECRVRRPERDLPAAARRGPSRCSCWGWWASRASRGAIPQLSGGMQQRAALGRALAHDPEFC